MVLVNNPDKTNKNINFKVGSQSFAVEVQAASVNTLIINK